MCQELPTDLVAAISLDARQLVVYCSFDEECAALFLDNQYRVNFMGVALYVQLDREIPEALASSVSGKSLARYLEQLDEVSTSEGLAPLSSFIGMGDAEIADILGDSGGDKDGSGQASWFNAEDALMTVRSLIRALEQKAENTTAKALQDLKSVEAVLDCAKKHEAKFHFAFDV